MANWMISGGPHPHQTENDYKGSFSTSAKLSEFKSITTSISDSQFRDELGITALSLPKLTSIGLRGFEHSQLTELYVPKLETADYDSFRHIINAATTTVFMPGKFDTKAEKDKMFGGNEWLRINFKFLKQNSVIREEDLKIISKPFGPFASTPITQYRKKYIENKWETLHSANGPDVSKRSWSDCVISAPSGWTMIGMDTSSLRTVSGHWGTNPPPGQSIYRPSAGRGTLTGYVLPFPRTSFAVILYKAASSGAPYPSFYMRIHLQRETHTAWFNTEAEANAAHAGGTLETRTVVRKQKVTTIVRAEATEANTWKTYADLFKTGSSIEKPVSGRKYKDSELKLYFEANGELYKAHANSSAINIFKSPFANDGGWIRITRIKDDKNFSLGGRKSTGASLLTSFPGDGNLYLNDGTTPSTAIKVDEFKIYEHIIKFSNRKRLGLTVFWGAPAHNTRTEKIGEEFIDYELYASNVGSRTYSASLKNVIDGDDHVKIHFTQWAEGANIWDKTPFAEPSTGHWGGKFWIEFRKTGSSWEYKFHLESRLGTPSATWENGSNSNITWDQWHGVSNDRVYQWGLNGGQWWGFHVLLGSDGYPAVGFNQYWPGTALLRTDKVEVL